MKQRILLFFVGILCSLGTWAADETLFSLSTPTGPTDKVASKATVDLVATISGGTAQLYNAKSSEIAMVSSNAISLSGSSSSYIKVTLTGNTFQANDYIQIDKAVKVSSTTSNGIATTDAGKYTIKTGDALIGNSVFYIFKGSKSSVSTIEVVRPDPSATKSSDATLYSIKYSGKSITLTAGTTSYDVTLAYGTETIPTVTAEATDGDATVTVTQATKIPGSATIAVTAADGTTTSSYSVNFKNSETAPTIPDGYTSFWKADDFDLLSASSSETTVNGLTLYNVAIDEGKYSNVEELGNLTQRFNHGGNGSTSKRYMKFHVDGPCQIVVWASSGSKDRSITISDGTNALTTSLATITADNAVVKDSYNYTGAAGDLYAWSTSSGIYILALGLKSTSTPVISASDATIAATVAGTAATTAIDVTGSNLTGTTLSASISPAVDGLSVSLDKTTISSGAITAVATLSYKSSVNVKAGTTTLTITDGTTSKAVTVNYSAKVADWTLQSISKATTWDWANVKSLTTGDDCNYNSSNKGTYLTKESTPTYNDEFVIANYDGVMYSVSSDFDATTMAFKGETPAFATSASKDYCQNGTLHFNTTVAGTVKVTFSDTGSSVKAEATPRYLIVNGNQTVYWTSRPTSGSTTSNDKKTVSVSVSAGDVYIASSQSVCFYTVEFTPGEVNVTKTLGTNGYSTYCSDYAFTATGATAYKATLSGTALTLTKIEGAIPAGEGIILKGETGDEVTIAPTTDAATALTDNCLTGVSSATTALATTGTNYFLASKQNADNTYTTAFVNTITTDLAAMLNKAYINIPASSGAKEFTIVFDDATGIENIATATESANDAAYNIAGQRVNANAKGIVIIGGKKYFNK